MAKNYTSPNRPHDNVQNIVVLYYYLFATFISGLKQNLDLTDILCFRQFDKITLCRFKVASRGMASLKNC